MRERFSRLGIVTDLEVMVGEGEGDYDVSEIKLQSYIQRLSYIVTNTRY